MRIRKLMLGALGAAVMSVAFGCSGLEPYSIEAPEDLAAKIAEYKAEQEREKPVIEGEEIALSPKIVGAEDNCAGWWAEFSQYFTLPAGKRLEAEFKNFSLGEGNYQNWCLCVSTVAERGAEGYVEFFVLRSDRWGWTPDGNITSGIVTAIDGVEEPDYDGDFWADFRTKMNGSTVNIAVDNAREGYCVVEASAKATDGSVITETYTQKVEEGSAINAFFIVDHSHIEFKSAYLVNSKVPEIPDFNATSITVNGFPAQVEVGTTLETVLSADLKATVVYADGTSEEVSMEDVNIADIPGFGETAGRETIVYSYSKTKKGKFGPSVAGYATIEVTNPVTAIEVSKAPVFTTYYFFENTSLDFRPAGMEVTATYADGTTGPMPLSNLTFSAVEVKEGPQEVTLSYKDVETTCSINLVKGAYAVGAPDFSNGWWSTFTPDFTVASGESKVFEMDVYSDNLANYHSPCVIVRKADLSLGAEGEYVVVREDHFGWGNSFETAVAESNWNWDYFAARLNASHVTITVTNNGDNTASIRYDVIDSEGESHFQSYSGFTVDSADVTCALVTEESYLVFVD